MYQTNPVGVKLFSYVKTFFCSNKTIYRRDPVNEVALYYMSGAIVFTASSKCEILVCFLEKTSTKIS